VGIGLLVKEKDKECSSIRVLMKSMKGNGLMG